MKIPFRSPAGIFVTVFAKFQAIEKAAAKNLVHPQVSDGPSNY
jgi:hypothetical protein